MLVGDYRPVFVSHAHMHTPKLVNSSTVCWEQFEQLQTKSLRLSLDLLDLVLGQLRTEKEVTVPPRVRFSAPDPSSGHQPARRTDEVADGGLLRL